MLLPHLRAETAPTVCISRSSHKATRKALMEEAGDLQREVTCSKIYRVFLRAERQTGYFYFMHWFIIYYATLDVNIAPVCTLI